MPITPNMDLELPTVSQTLGPEWATELNTALETVDAHDHTSGRGVQVPSAGIGVDASLEMNGYDLTETRTVRFDNQSGGLNGAEDIACIYSGGGNLFFNDASGVQIQLTAGGALNAASIGGIGGDYGTSTASVYYQSVDETFYFTSDTDTPATVNVGSVIVREPSVSNPDSITIKSPASLPTSYDITLPTALPASTLPLSMSAAGVLAAGQISTAQIANGAVTSDKIAASVSISTLSATNLTAGNLNASTTMTYQSKNVAVANTNESQNQSIIRGYIAANGGSIYDGSGFSITPDVANGRIAFQLTSNFFSGSYPAVIIQPVGGNTTAYMATVNNAVSQSGWTVQFYDSSGTPLAGSTPEFMFIAIGRLA